MAENILINFPTNIGDTILGLPVLDKLRANYPKSVITVIASPYTKDFLSRNNFVNEVIVFDKAWSSLKKMKFSFSLKGNFDMVVDLKNSFLPVILGCRVRTPFVRKFPLDMHAKDTYLAIIEKLAPASATTKSDFTLTEEEKSKWAHFKLSPSVFIACSSRSSLKSYPYRYLKEVSDSLRKDCRLVILGEESDRKYYKDILFQEGVVDLVGKTKLYDIFYLLKNYAQLLLCVDSSILQLGSYLNLPLVALFGPTDPRRYGPWSDTFIVLRDERSLCLPCKKPTCNFTAECMQIMPAEVLGAIEKMLKKL